MSNLDTTTIEAARQLREHLAGVHWPTEQARLFSQHTRLEYQQEGLVSWQEIEGINHLDDAIRLLEAASVEREAGHPLWRNSVRRAAELLEWLAHPQMNTHEHPLQLLSAAAYQIAGYPARASGLLSYPSVKDSPILRFLLKGDFLNLSTELTNYWSKNILSQADHLSDDQTIQYHIQQNITKNVVSILGILCAKMRWGKESRLKKALSNFNAIEQFLLYGNDRYSWLLSKLVAEVLSFYVTNSLRDTIQPLLRNMDELGKLAMERYLRQGYSENKNIAWPSQLKGIEQLEKNNSFALCTPTGSGKTSIAELAIIQSLFTTAHTNHTKLDFPLFATKPLVIYLVPSRALATEVECKLSQVLRKLDTSIIVTGLYGGTDWGPTDAWLTSTDRTVLICTYEKGEALIRFLGPRFLQRVSLVVIDEAHAIQFESTNDQLTKGENRALRLESLGSRLLHYLTLNQGRVIALSAVATGIEKTLASWVTKNTEANPTQTSYRSVRQLIGRLVCEQNKKTTIYYDMLDGVRLNRKEKRRSGDFPYIPEPFKILPDKQYNDATMKRLSPYIFWAAIHFAQRDKNGHQHAVLISITEHMDYYAKDFLKMLNENWNDVNLPIFFQEPPQHSNLWEQCLRSCEDYFGRDSYTYRLLKKGIVVHQGSMPGALGRLFTELIQERLVHIVLATSTLSEGVNLPFETILIPSLKRWVPKRTWKPHLHRYVNGVEEPISHQEFGNLIGRSGRPGTGTEGRSLVVMGSSTNKTYEGLIEKVSETTQQNNAQSPLAALLRYLENQWRSIANYAETQDFFVWLEQTAPLDVQQENISILVNDAIETLDTLDGLLLSTIVEIEQINQQIITSNVLEVHLQNIWKCTYANYASEQETRLQDIFITRGKSLTTRIYPNARWRRNLYCTGLPPRRGSRLVNRYPEIKQYLKKGDTYALWNRQKRIEYISGLIEHIANIPGYQIEMKSEWKNILNWWLDCTIVPGRRPPDITKWHKYVRTNFIYRVNWGIGSIVALASDEAFGNQPIDFTLTNWPSLGLPWVVLWLKELLTWGTTEPVAAYLLAHKMATTRMEAEITARQYYNQFQNYSRDPNEYLNAVYIMEWSQANFNEARKLELKEPPAKMHVQVLRDFSHAKRTQWRVLPVEMERSLYWYDLAGFPMARNSKPSLWDKDFVNSHDFILNSQDSTITSGSYVGKDIDYE